MAKRIFGWILFLWMLGCVVGAGYEAMHHSGPELGSEIGALLFCAVLGTIGLKLALSKDKQIGETQKSD